MAKPDSAPNRTLLPGANRLTPATVVSVLHGSESLMVAIVAPTGSGKTSLIAGVYDLFQNGPIGELVFAGSTTLHAFEAACHDSRAASLRNEPDMKRTPVSGVSFYHVQVGSIEAGPACALVLADRAGEEYRLVVDDTRTARTLVELARAECLCLLVDGKRLLDAGDRHNLRSELELLVKAMVDGGAVRPGQHLSIVLTKVDEIIASPDRERAERDFQTIVANLRRHYNSAFGSISDFRVAASPKKAVVERGIGLPELLQHWIGSTIPEPTCTRAPIVPERAFGRLTPTDA